MTFRLPSRAARTSPASFRTPGEALAWVAGFVFTLSAFMGWYTGVVDGLHLSAVAWQTGIVGKLVFFIGLAVLVFLTLRATGVELPPTIPVGFVLSGLGLLATIAVIYRLLAIPDDYADFGRSIGIWISLAAALLLIVAGLLKASEEL